MNDELDVLSRVLDYHDHIAVPRTAAADDVRRGRQRVRRHRTFVTAGAALGVAAVVATVAVVASGSQSEPPPVGPTPTPTLVEDPTPPPEGNGAGEGRIVAAEQAFKPGPPPCDGCSDPAFLKAYDAATDRALWSFYDLDDQADGAVQVGGLTVVGPDDHRATLACGDQFACRPDDDLWTSAVTLGPGSEEITIETADRQLQVIRYDGEVRQTLDLAADFDRYERVDALAWSPDRRRLAVQTSANRIWLFDRDGGEPVLAHTAAFPDSLLPAKGEFARLTYLRGLAWSADGTMLGLIEEHATFLRSMETPLSLEAVAIQVPGAGQDGPGTATTLFQYNTGRGNTFFGGQVLWSPDGTRVAVRIRDGIVELSPDDGSVLARRPAVRGSLVWRG